MSRSRSDKKISYLDSSFKDILVCKKNERRPYMEIFIQEPENIGEQSLGTIAGILEIVDDSEDSSYIVNYLISIIKKEYFSKVKRGAIESLEGALHKVNLALAKLAQHGNINWIGKFNAIVLVIEKNNIHLSQTGSAKALMLRKKILTDISESAPSGEEPNPLKTFIDVLSGRLENNDKLIITTDSIFDIFSFEEIKRSALKFSSSDFIQFLKTALGNELEKAMVLIVETQEKNRTVLQPDGKTKTKLNAFSQTTFSKVSRRASVQEGKRKIAEELKDELKKSRGEFVDQKTGHIYIKEDRFLKEEKRDLSLQSITGFLSQLIKWPKISLRSRKNLERAIVARAEEKLLGREEMPKGLWNSIKIGSEKIYFTLIRLLSKVRGIALKIMPRISRLKNIISGLDYSQKLYAALAVILLFIVPYFIVKIQNKSENSDSVSPEATAPVFAPLEQDKNVSVITDLSHAYSGSDIMGIANLKDSFFTVSRTKITDPKNNKSYPMPENFIPAKIAGMDDLNLLFLLGENNSLLSWSPLSGKFQENQLVIPENSASVSLKTYLTYLYFLDSKNNQIYRYPRAEGGFGAGVNWIKENIDLSQTKDLAVSENIYIAGPGQIIKLYRGKKQDFAIENTATPIKADKIYTIRDGQYIYVMDQTNARIIKLDLNGAIVSQYYNAEIKNAADFTVDETANLIYFSTSDSVKSFGIN